ncbi:MAG: response regulator transcription factor [Lachnospiraceae bacterium]|nr:response regulator transcription factor [Lachnospiraceae bacterium]
MRIAICDDDNEMLGRLKKDVIEIFGVMKVNIEIFSFSNGKELLRMIQNDEENFDLFLLDIDMPDVSGLEIAQMLREMSVNLIIIFISAYDNYVFDSIEYSPFRYIRKSRINQELPLALKAAHTLLEKEQARYIGVKTEEGDYKISHSEIWYFEIENRRLYIYLTRNRVIKTWKTVKEFFIELNDENFVKIHSGCAINLKYIREYSSYDVTLDNGKKLLASRSGIKAIKSTLPKYWSEHI